MDRRDFSRRLGGLAGVLALAGGAPVRALAQGGAPLEDHDFKRLARPLRVNADGKIEVIEFFWYGCPHCFAFEPSLEAWVVNLPADVQFRRVPVGFDALKQIHQRIYYTWEALGIADQMQMKTFMRFHVQRRPINSEADIVTFAHDSGLDLDKVSKAWHSFGVQSKVAQAIQLADDYGIDQTPEMGIQGRFTAMPAQGVGNMLRTTEWLLAEIRKGR
jgi:thiol:disulfide interchange protein DsbA